MKPSLSNYPITLITVLIAMVTVSLQASRADAATPGSNAWERRQLHHPSDKLLKMEQRGRVTIYDGLQESEVNKAMDEQFDRIDRMMFIRMKTEDGYGLDDGCD